MDIFEFCKNGVKSLICTLDLHANYVPSKDANQLTSWICNSCELCRLGNRSKSSSFPALMAKSDTILSVLNEVKATIYPNMKSHLFL